MVTGFADDAIGLRGSRSCALIQPMPPTRSTVMAGMDQTIISMRPEYSQSGKCGARALDERNQKATPSVATMVGMTMASMIPSESKRIVRSADAIGPFGSRTPSEQPQRAAAASTARTLPRYCQLNLIRGEIRNGLSIAILGRVSYRR